MGLIIAIATFALLLFLSLALRKTLLVSTSISLLFYIAFSIVFLDQTALAIGALSLHGLLTAIEINLLIFGALFYYNYLKAGTLVELLNKLLLAFSSNKTIVVILLSVFFGSFLEGVSGFGTPAMIIAPLILTLGFKPVLAAALALFANTVPVIFGAVGTPVKVGFADLPLEGVSVYAVALMFLPALILPLCIQYMVGKYGSDKHDYGNLSITGICLTAGFCFLLPFYLTAFNGPDFPSIVGAVAGLLLWMAFLKASRTGLATINFASIKQIYQTFKPYLFIALLLILVKMILGTSKFMIAIPQIGLNKAVSYFQPGLIFIAGLFILELISKNTNKISISNVLKQTTQTLPATFLTIVFLTVLAKLLSVNLQIESLFGTNVNLPASLYYVSALSTGLLGSFMAGSATVSNLLFGEEWYQIATMNRLNLPLILASQLAGAALGNSLSIQNIAMVQAVLNQQGLEGSILKMIWKPSLLLFVLVVVGIFICGLYSP